jgi:hypothetical protein
MHYFGFLISSANKLNTQFANHVSLEPCTCIVKGDVIVNGDGCLLHVEISNNWVISFLCNICQLYKFISNVHATSKAMLLL